MLTTQNQKQPISRVFLKVIVVNVLNLLVFIALVVLLRQLPTVALSVKKANTQKQLAEHSVDSTVLNSEVEKYADKTKLIQNTLKGDQTVITFVSQMDEIKKLGILTTYDFPVTAEVTDKTGLHGLPVIATLVGTRQEVSDTLVAIGSSDLLIRPVTLTMTIDETGKYTAQYGMFLYTQ